MGQLIISSTGTITSKELAKGSKMTVSAYIRKLVLNDLKLNTKLDESIENGEAEFKGFDLGTGKPIYRLRSKI